MIVDEPTAASRSSAANIQPLNAQPIASQQSPTGDVRLARRTRSNSRLRTANLFAGSAEPICDTIGAAIPIARLYQTDDGCWAGKCTSPIAYNTIDGPYLQSPDCCPEGIDYADVPYTFQVLPQGLIWHSYLAGPKEPRFNALLISGQNVGEKFEGQVGGRVGLLRYGDMADYRPQGVQVDVEGGGIIEEDELKSQLVDGFDFRVGVPITFGWENWTMKVSWYHTSAHLGDEFILANPTFPRINYSRNAIVWGLGYYLPHDVRIYGEIDYGYWTDGGNKPWAFQFGFEYSPDVRALHGARFWPSTDSSARKTTTAATSRSKLAGSGAVCARSTHSCRLPLPKRPRDVERILPLQPATTRRRALVRFLKFSPSPLANGWHAGNPRQAWSKAVRRCQRLDSTGTWCKMIICSVFSGSIA